jgi:hypothetical protein
MIKLTFVLLLSIPLFSCGIEKLYYLPQVSISNIHTTLNTEAVITIPNTLNQSEYDELSPSYSIYYRIYISNLEITSEILPGEMSRINTVLNSDYIHFFPFTDSTNQTSVLNANSFRNRNYHELDHMFQGESLFTALRRGGGTLNLNFPVIPGNSPTLSEPNRIDPVTREPFSRNLSRNRGDGQNHGLNFSLEPDRRFFYTDDLVLHTNTTDTNLDVHRPAAVFGFAYVSMYLVAVGANPTDFSRVFSKPTHIGVFKLPNLH